MNEKSPHEQTSSDILIGSAPKGQSQIKLKTMKNFLKTKKGSGHTEKEIRQFSSCSREKDLKKIIKFYTVNKILYNLYTNYVTRTQKQKLWFAENAISKSPFEKYEKNRKLEAPAIYDVDLNFRDFDEENDFF